MATSITRGHAGNSATVDRSAMVPILPANEPGVRRLLVRCMAASTDNLRVGVVNKAAHRDHQASLATVHQIAAGTLLPTEYMILAPGESYEFTAESDNPIVAAYVDGNATTATFSWTVGEV